jgi:hypothetical protein
MRPLTFILIFTLIFLSPSRAEEGVWEAEDLISQANEVKRKGVIAVNEKTIEALDKLLSKLTDRAGVIRVQARISELNAQNTLLEKAPLEDYLKIYEWVLDSGSIKKVAELGSSKFNIPFRYLGRGQVKVGSDVRTIKFSESKDSFHYNSGSGRVELQFNRGRTSATGKNKTHAYKLVRREKKPK